jgi:hypothetical protein
MTTISRTIPEGLDLVVAQDGITVRKVWLTWKILPLAGFAVIWDTFMFFWYSQVLSKPNPPLIMVFFPIGHVAVGIGLTYYVVAALVNKTDVVISSSGIRVVTGPAPWFGNKEVRVEDITDIMVRERWGNRGRKTYNVMYADRSQKERKLVSWLPESDQAGYIAETIRDTLGLRSKNA